MSDGVEWGLHCLTLLATAPEGAVAEFHGVSESYLLKHLKALTRAGLLRSLAGPRGGFQLGRDPAAITALDVVEAVDGRDPAFRCAEIRRCGPAAAAPSAYRTACGIHRAMAAAEQTYRAALREVRLSDLVANLGDSVPPESLPKARAWLAATARG